MTELGEGAPKIPKGKNTRLVREARQSGTPPWGDVRARDGDSARKTNQEIPLTPYALERAKIEEADRARKKLAASRLNTGDVIVPTEIKTGGTEDVDAEH